MFGVGEACEGGHYELCLFHFFIILKASVHVYVLCWAYFPWYQSLFFLVPELCFIDEKTTGLGR